MMALVHSQERKFEFSILEVVNSLLSTPNGEISPSPETPFYHQYCRQKLNFGLQERFVPAEI